MGDDGTAFGVPSDPQATTSAAQNMLLSTTGVRVNSWDRCFFMRVLSDDVEQDSADLIIGSPGFGRQARESALRAINQVAASADISRSTV